MPKRMIHTLKHRRNIALGCVIGLFCLLLVAQVSYHRGFVSGALDSRQTRSKIFASEQLNVDLQAALTQLEANHTQAQLELDQLRETGNQLQYQIANLAAQNVNLSEENNLYKKILAPENQQNGIQINSVKIYPLQAQGKYQYEVLLAKFTHQKEESAGVMQLYVQGVQDEELIQIPLEASSRDWPEGQPYKVRYFQMLKGQISLPEDFNPESLQVSLIPQNKKDKSSTEDFPWLVSIG